MKRSIAYRALWLAGSAGLVLLLLWLDQARGGPASPLSRCNLLLSRDASPAADVLLLGSSRTGAALDPLAMQAMFALALPGTAPTVDRIALGRNPLRSSHALLDNYLELRGAPRVLVLEIMFMTERSIDRLAERGFDLPPEQYVFRRDANLMTFAQLIKLPSVAMPFSERETVPNRWRYRLRGVALRAGALLYQFLRRPAESWHLSTCDKDAWTREPEWPANFAFSYGSFTPDAPPGVLVESLAATMAGMAAQRPLRPWQAATAMGQRYPYDFAAPYRAGEVAMLNSMLDMALRRGVPVVLLPLPLYGFAPGDDDLRTLARTLPAGVHVFDLYRKMPGELDRFWYDDGHIETYPGGALATAILAQHLLDTGVLGGSGAAEPGDD